MLTLLASATLAFCAADFQDDAAKTTATQADDATKELIAATGALAKAESYSFTLENSGGSNFGGGRGGRGRGGAGGGEGGGEPPPPPPATKGTFKKGLPLHLSQGETVAYKDGDQLVYKNEEGEWQQLDMAAFGRGGRGQGGARGGGGQGGGERGGGERGGERGGDGGGERGGEGGGERGAGRDRGGFAGMRALFTLRGANAPHTSLADFGDKIDSAKKTEKDGVVTFTGDLTEEGAQALSGRSAFGGRGGRGGGQGPTFEYDGTYTIVLEQGAVASVSFEVTMSGSFGDRDFERTTSTKMAISEVGKAKLEVPEEALAQFEI